MRTDIDDLKCVDNANQWTVLALEELSLCTHRNAALLGDAVSIHKPSFPNGHPDKDIQAHAMAPFQGSGAGQAIEDAYILGSLLGHPKVTLETVSDALKIYEAIRLPHANEVQRRSAQAGWLLSFQDPISAQILDDPSGKVSKECTGDDIGKLWETGHTLITRWMWAWSTDIESDRARAMDLLEKKLDMNGVSK